MFRHPRPPKHSGGSGPGGALPFQCLIDLPHGYEDDRSRRWPLILFLHGISERGVDPEKVRANGLPRLIAEGLKIPFIVASPQCPTSQWWTTQLERLRDFLDALILRHRVDPDRVYLTGLSMGGNGAWELAVDYPDRFAALAPVCGPMSHGPLEKIVKLPTWVFHGEADAVVPLRESQEMVAMLKALGHQDIRLKIYPGVGHDSWTPAYSDPALYEWFLKHRRPPPRAD
jgi:predicted peptidase